MTSPARARRPSIVAAALAWLPVVVIWLPLGSSSTSASTSAGGPERTVTEHVSLLATEGWTVLIPFVIAGLLASAPLLLAGSPHAPTVRRVVAVLFALGVLVALMSIGIFFVPALVALIAAAASDRTTARARFVTLRRATQRARGTHLGAESCGNRNGGRPDRGMARRTPSSAASPERARPIGVR